MQAEQYNDADIADAATHDDSAEEDAEEDADEVGRRIAAQWTSNPEAVGASATTASDEVVEVVTDGCSDGGECENTDLPSPESHVGEPSDGAW